MERVKTRKAKNKRKRRNANKNFEKKNERIICMCD